MRVLCSALYIFLAISADAFVVGPKNAALSTQRIQTLTPLFMSDAPEATGSEDVAVEESAPAPAATDSASDSDAADEKPAYPKERHTIYVGNLPYGVSVPEVKEIFAPHVPVQYVSLPRNTETGEIKGFAFIDVASEDDIQKAVEALNGVEMEGRALRVSKVLPKDQVRSRKESKKNDANKLFVGNVDFQATVEDIKETFEEFGTIVDVFVPKNSLGESRGFAFVTVGEGEVESVMNAANGVEMMGRALVVNPPLAPGEKNERKKRGPRTHRQKLYVGNLSFYTNEETLIDVFAEFGNVHDCYIPQDPDRGSSRGFGFITMDEEASSEAIDALDGCELDGRIIAVNPAKAKDAPQENDEDEDESEED